MHSLIVLKEHPKQGYVIWKIPFFWKISDFKTLNTDLCESLFGLQKLILHFRSHTRGYKVLFEFSSALLPWLRNVKHLSPVASITSLNRIMWYCEKCKLDTSSFTRYGRLQKFTDSQFNVDLILTLYFKHWYSARTNHLGVYKDPLQNIK